jgi:hypothetical protein
MIAQLNFNSLTDQEKECVRKSVCRPLTEKQTREFVREFVAAWNYEYHNPTKPAPALKVLPY